MNTLTAQKRDLNVKAKKLRREGFVIGNLFGRDIENSVPLKLDPRETTKFLKDNKKGAHITLKIEDKDVDAMIKEIDYNPMKKEISSINFQALVADEKIHATTPVELLNEAAVQGGIVEQSLSEIEYKAYPADLVDAVEIDLANYKVGDLIHVKDLDLAKNSKITLVTPEDTLVVNIAEPEAAPEDEDEEDAAATAE
ncbi:50S ribosomal protein L25 [Anaerostipes sp. MSJ-23]|uniref:50S ribosomal protein L25 n=1 Tax=unclassified Anaerostipes TaxID=2635253 RepID=UPI001C11DD2D|nr:50S ribosomal protein L25 [Anaerostipes sp. MSJ-23]MBU5459137.1 50S ribosomal protein L25 [Anaerostipes sp. MSJ-23]